MGRSTVIIVTLSVALVLSNLWWLYYAFDSGVTATYQAVSLQDNHDALAQALAVLPVAARVDSKPSEVLAAAAGASSRTGSFEKDGFTWVGHLGFQFGDNGRLIAVSPSWEPF